MTDYVNAISHFLLGSLQAAANSPRSSDQQNEET